MLLAAGVLVTAPNAVFRSLPAAAAADCPDVEVVFARGTGESPGVGRVGQAFVDSLRQDTGKDIGVYAVDYKASLLQLHGGDGANDAVSHIKSMADKCPGTPLVLGGYSQGASVIDIVTGVSVGGISWGSPLPAQYANNVAAVATFGNPADRSGGPISTQSSLFGAKAIDLCNPTDPICHAGPGNQWSGHADGYVPTYTSRAAIFVAAKLLAAVPVVPLH
jgi:cutinase